MRPSSEQDKTDSEAKVLPASVSAIANPQKFKSGTAGGTVKQDDLILGGGLIQYICISSNASNGMLPLYI